MALSKTGPWRKVVRRKTLPTIACDGQLKELRHGT